MKQLATSPAADPSLSVQMEDQNRLAMEAGTAAFELNYPFVYPSMKADQPEAVQELQVGACTRASIPGQPAKVTIGGIDLAVSALLQAPQDAFEASLCLRDAENQKIAAIKGGLPPTLDERVQRPVAVQADYPFRADDPDADPERRGAAEDAGLPEPLDRDLALRVAADRINPISTEQHGMQSTTRSTRG